MDRKSLTILIVEDDPDYIFLLRDLLSEVGRFRKDYADVLSKAIDALGHRAFDLVLLDLNLPDSRGLETVRRIVAAAPGIPVIVLTSMDDETMGIQAIQEGAQDYLIKGEISAKGVSRAIDYAVERKNLLVQIERNMLEIRILRGLLPICCYCKKIRDDKGYWEEIEVYIRDHSEATFTHGMCPSCAKKAMKEIDDFSKRENVGGR